MNVQMKMFQNFYVLLTEFKSVQLQIAVVVFSELRRLRTVAWLYCLIFIHEQHAVCADCLAMNVINDAMHKKTESGQLVQSYLLNGDVVPDRVVFDLIIEKVRSPEVAHQGK